MIGIVNLGASHFGNFTSNILPFFVFIVGSARENELRSIISLWSTRRKKIGGFEGRKEGKQVGRFVICLSRAEVGKERKGER